MSEFSKNARKRDGLQTSCKACARVASDKWRAENPDKERARAAQWYADNTDKKKAWAAANAEKVLAYKASWRAANPDRQRAAVAAWNASNPGRKSATNAAWQAANPERARAAVTAWQKANPERVRINSQNRRALKREAGGKLSKDIAEKLFKLQRGKCACGCRQPLGTDYHLDHRMPLALGGANDDWNIQLLTAKCNLQKNKKHPIEYMQQKGFLL